MAPAVANLEHIESYKSVDKTAKRVETLGTIRHRHEHTNEIILVPTPSSDPNDPLNWSQGFKYYTAFIICLSMFMSNFLAAGPTIAIVQTAQDFFPNWMEIGLVPAISKVAYFFTSTSLIQGTGNLIWMPLVNKYGRRPIYLISYTIYLACAIWAACTQTYGSFLAARILIGFGSGAAETNEKVNAAAYIEAAPSTIPKKKSYVQRLKIFSGTYTEESFWKLFFRPLALILLPPILWCALVQSVTIGFIVAVTSNVASAYETAYGFKPYQTGLCFFAAIIGAMIGILAGGHLSDQVADFFTKRNGGFREPEMRLPAVMISVITTPLALLLYGAGIQYNLHWMCPTVGLALLNFSVVQATNVALVYIIDGYRPIAGEVTLTTMGFKSAFGFLLSFYTNPWIAQAGYMHAYGEMAGISAAVLICWVPLYIWGKRIRHATWEWRIMKFVHWDEDREVGE
ncbi:putative MFS-type transporter [Lachnellula willkommii]|uniref:Putative MFS-type transporter n=1 Tax=Lachnellula willkommii TaxID=215461 RepID=A0A559M6C9_9HELO|nr:putative MFS-type transporter [Lachnellula willkommii]